jgi:hypothetical protein
MNLDWYTGYKDSSIVQGNVTVATVSASDALQQYKYTVVVVAVWHFKVTVLYLHNMQRVSGSDEIL